jgi:ACR3 family arsenite efflux pump ArsB
MIAPKLDNNPYTPLGVGSIEQDRRPARPWMAAILTLLSSAVAPVVACAIAVMVSGRYQLAFRVAAEDILKLFVFYGLGWCLIPGLISAVLASQLARGRSTAREVLLFWGLIGMLLTIVGVASLTAVKQVHQLTESIAIIGPMFVFQAVITIFLGRLFCGTDEIESDAAVVVDPEG